MKKKHLSIVMLILLFSTLAQAQQDTLRKNEKTIKRFDLVFENGVMLPSVSDLSNAILNASYYNGVTLRMTWQTESPYLYSSIYNNPVYGIGYYSSTFHNDKIGRPNALYGFARIPWYRGKKWNFSYELGFGLSYNFNPYNDSVNTENLMIGSYRNAFIHLNANAEYQFTDRFQMGVGIGFKHFSNGSLQQPNAGINLIPGSLYAVYTFDKRKPDYSKTEVAPFQQNHHFQVVVAPGSKSYEYNDKNYLVGTMSFQYLYQVGYKARWGAGLDVFYKGSGPDRVEGSETNFQKSMSYALTGTYDWVLTERLWVNVALGIYLKRHYNNEEFTPYYERVSPRYRFSKHMFAGIGIKAHKASADYIEFTLGYDFFRDQNKYRP
jgi:hypothetical protein